MTRIAFEMILYPFQKEAKEAVLQHWERGNKAALISMPTGSGKTIVFSEILRASLSPNGERGLVLVHRDELLRQGVEKIRLVWPQVSLSTVDACSRSYSGQVTLGSVMSVVRRLEEVPRIGTVVTDEAHHAPARSWLKIYDQVGGVNPDWCHLGVTATPIRAKGTSDLEAIFGKPVYVKSIFELIVEGYLCPLRGLEVRTEVSVEEVGVHAGDFLAEELSRVINTRDRNRLIVENYLELASERKALVFAADLNHARNLTDMFKTYGVNAAWISGETPMRVRRSILKCLREGEIKVVVNCMVFTEGFDEPSLEAILIARPTRSLVLYCQMIGRGLRPYPGKKNCLFLDFVDNSSKHRPISMQELLMFYQTRRTEKSIAELLARKLSKDRHRSFSIKGQKSPLIDLSPTSLPLLVGLENLSSTVKEIDLFGLEAFAWHKAGGSHYVHVNDDLSLLIRPDCAVQGTVDRPDALVDGSTVSSPSNGYFLYAVFPRVGLYASLFEAPVDFDLAYGCGNAYLFDYGDPYLATRGPRWRSEGPSEGQRNLFQRLCREVKELSSGSIAIPKPPERRGDYSGAITALNAEKVILTGERMDPEKAKDFIKENLHAHIASSEEIPITLKSDGNPTIEAALRKAIATFSDSEEGDFRHYLKMILMENQIFLDGNSVRVGHVKFPRYMTARQLNAAMKRITEEIRLYAPNAEVTFAKFPVQHGGREEWKDSEDSA